jgi:hypothetical protein
MDISKIRKLIEKEQSCRAIGNQEEADAFLLKIQELIMQYNLDLDTIKEDQKNDSGIRQESIIIDISWQEELLDNICKNFLCKVIPYWKYTYKDGSYMDWRKKNIVGKVHNIEACIYMFKFYCSEIMQLSVKAYTSDIEQRRAVFGSNWKKVEKEFNEQHRQKYIRDYYIGCVHGISRRMRDEKEKMERGAQDLMIINDSQVNEYIEREYSLIVYETPKEEEKKRGRPAKVKYRKLTKREQKEIENNKMGNGYHQGYSDGYAVQKGETRVTSGDKKLS